MSHLQEKTIQDFGDQWSKYVENDGHYGSSALFKDFLMPLLDPADLNGKTVVDIGSGTGRIVSMILESGASHVYAIEPSRKAFDVLTQNVKGMERSNRVTTMNKKGDQLILDEPVDYVLSLGVIHHIPDPDPVIKAAYESLKPGGRIFIWLYGYEGNELYLTMVNPLRWITTRLPHVLLRVTVELLYGMLYVYKYVGVLVPLPLHSYIRSVLWPLAPSDRRLIIYDQLNPSYAKYYKKNEAISLLERAGFTRVEAYHRHNYSWSVMGRRPG